VNQVRQIEVKTTFVAEALRTHCAIAAQSLQNHWEIDAQKLANAFKSLGERVEITVQTLCKC
jgi:hypothetical protein